MKIFLNIYYNNIMTNYIILSALLTLILAYEQDNVGYESFI